VEGQGFLTLSEVEGSPATKTTARSAFLCAAFLAACTRIPALESTTYNHRLRQPNGARSTFLNRPIDFAFVSPPPTDSGSLVPEAPSLTYTAAEFEHARKHNRPIIAFIQTEGGTWTNKEPVGPLRDALDAFKKDVDATNITAAYFENVDQLRTEIVLAIQKWNDQGRPGARLTFTTRSEFFAPFRTAGTPRLFDFQQVLRGRTVEIDALNAFLAGPKLIVGVLPGRGGIGKTKLLHDWSATRAGTTVLYVRDNAAWHPEAFKEIPVGNVVIVADDAHRLSFLDELLGLVRVLAERQSVKIVLGTRPSGLGQIDATLSTRFETSQVQRFGQLRQISNRSVIELAEESLGASCLHYAYALAAVSEDTPLVTVVGGRLIARGEIEPSLLANHDEFRHTVFDRFSAEYERLLPTGAVNWRTLLNLIAAISPLDPNSTKFVEPAAEILRVRVDEVRAAVDQLERNGLLLRGGRLVRIVPDLLSDFLLEGGCVTASGDSTEFADLVYNTYKTTYLSNILRNLGELDWRMTHTNHDARLLDRIWQEIRSNFEAADASGRLDLLKSLREASWFQPARVEEIVNIAMETEAATTLSDWKLEQKHVLRELPSLLQPIAHHLDHLESAAKSLWELSQRDSADESIGHSPNGWSALENLAEYGRYKPVELNIRMAEVIARFTQLPGAFDKRHTPLDLADKLLAKEGQFTDQDGFTISIGAFPFNYPVVKPARDRALALVEEGLNSENMRVARRAVQSTANVLSGFLPMMGRELGEEEVARQNAEREVVLQMLEKRLQKLPLPVPLLRKIRSVLLRARPWTRDIPVTRRIDEVLAAAPQTDDVLIFDAFWSSPWDHDGRYETIEQADEARRDLIECAVNAFTAKYRSPANQISALVELVTEAESAGIDRGGKCGDFVQKLCLDAAFVEELIGYVLGDPDPFLGQLISVPLAVLRSVNAARYKEVGLRGAAHETVSVGLGTAAAVCYGPPLANPFPEDLAIIEALSHHANAWVRHNTFLGIRRIGAHQEYERDAVRVAIETNIDDSPVLAEQMCEVFGPGGVNVEHLTEDDVRAILHKLSPLKELDGHDMARFLSQTGRAYPALVFSFTMQRLDRAGAILARGESLKGYDPIPGRHLGSTFHSLRNGPDYPKFMAQIRDRFVGQPDLRYWLAKIFWDIGMADATTLSIIDELVHSGDKETVHAGIGLLSGAPSGLALSRPQFTVHIIETCGEMDRNLAVRASAGFIGNAHTGAFQRTPGSPSPKFQQMAQRATALQDLFPPGTAGHEFFSKLRESAEAVLERERLDDEEFGFG
jgi:hypothetical protein